MDILFLIALAVGIVVTLLLRSRAASRLIAGGFVVGAVAVAAGLVFFGSGSSHVGGQLMFGLAVVVAVAVVIVGLTVGLGVSLGSSLVGKRPAGLVVPVSDLDRVRQKFVDGGTLDPEDVMVLVHASRQDPSLVTLRDRVRGDSLLHWCARLKLPEHAAGLLDHGASADASNGQGRRPFADVDDEFMARVGRARTAA